MKYRLFLNRIVYHLILLVLLVNMVSCKPTEQISKEKPISNNKYDSSPAGVSIDKSIKEISESVKKIDVIAFYKTWYFQEENEITKETISNSKLDDLSNIKIVSNESVSGTAYVVYYNNNTVGLITCAHIITYPDTVYSYYDEEKTQLKSVSEKIRQQIYITGLSSGEDVEVVVMDIDKDIAFLKKLLSPDDLSLKHPNINVGSTNKLEWGSQIYVLGYPLGNLMLTKGVVSIGKGMKKRFLSDALYNKGISGSPVFATLDGSSNFEWIGMATSASAQTFQYLIPDQKSTDVTDYEGNYKGNINVDEKILINYGVTHSIAIEEIITFIARYRPIITEKGFHSDLLPTKIKN